MATARWQRLGVAAGAVLALWMLPLQLWLFWAQRFPRPPRDVDFANYLAAAQVGLHYGWSRIYDATLQQPYFLALTGKPAYVWYYLFVSPPPVAWIVAPLTPLGLTAAYWAWLAISAVVYVAACLAVMRWRGVGSVIALVVGFGLYPVLIAFQFGQITPLLAATVAVAWRLLSDRREVAAGLVLVAIVLKPQVAILVPVALLLAGYRTCFLVWMAGAAVVAAASVASLGGSGLHQVLLDLQEEQRHADNQLWTVAYLVGLGLPATILQAAAVLAALVGAWFSRTREPADPTTPVIAGSLASLLAASYHHSVDFPVLFPLALIQLRTLRGWPAGAFAVAGVLACWSSPRLGPGPVLTYCLVWLLLASARPLLGSSLNRRLRGPRLGAT